MIPTRSLFGIRSATFHDQRFADRDLGVSLMIRWENNPERSSQNIKLWFLNSSDSEFKLENQ